MTVINFTLLYSEEDYRTINLQNIVEYNQVLDYNIIKNKLTKVDYLKKTPSDSVISFHMFKKLNAIIKEDSNTNILYILQSFNPAIINNIETVVEGITQRFNKEFNIQILSNAKIINEEVVKKYGDKVFNIYGKH